MTWETEIHQQEVFHVESSDSHVVGRMMVIHDRESKDCRFWRPATSTQRGPIVYGVEMVSLEETSEVILEARFTIQNTPKIAPASSEKNTNNP